MEPFRLLVELDKLVLLEVEMRCGEIALFVDDEIGDMVESISWRSSCESARLKFSTLFRFKSFPFVF